MNFFQVSFEFGKERLSVFARGRGGENVGAFNGATIGITFPLASQRIREQGTIASFRAFLAARGGRVGVGVVFFGDKRRGGMDCCRSFIMFARSGTPNGPHGGVQWRLSKVVVAVVGRVLSYRSGFARPPGEQHVRRNRASEVLWKLWVEVFVLIRADASDETMMESLKYMMTHLSISTSIVSWAGHFCGMLWPGFSSTNGGELSPLNMIPAPALVSRYPREA